LRPLGLLSMFTQRMPGHAGVTMLILVWLAISASACGADASEEAEGHSDANRDNRSAAKDDKKPPPADYDGPAKPGLGPTEVVLRVSGSEGGAYKGWVYTDRQIGPDALIHTDRPDFRGVIRSEPTEYHFTQGHGSYKDPTGDWVWNGLNVDLKKDTRGGRDWEGEMNAKMTR
jgi:hypothetical protein